MKISIKAIDNPIIVTLFTVSVLVIGLISLSFLPLELFPEVETPYVFVTVQYPGASPSEIEYQINKKIEDELKTLSDFKQITSIAAQGVGTVVIQFRSKSNVDVKRSEVKEAMDNVLPDLPKGIETPIIRKLDFAKVPVMSVLIYGKGKNYVELKDIAEDIKEIFEEIPQVSNVQIFGGEDREITIAVNPLQIWGNKISLTQVVQFFAGANLDSPGGKISIGKRDYPIRTLAKFKDVTDVKNTVFTYRDGKPIYLKDLGEIYDGKAEVTSFARLNGDPAIALAIIKESKTNLIKLSDGISKRIEMIKSSGLLPKGLDIKIVGDQTSEVKIRVNELTSNVIQGIIAVFIILFIGLGAKNALIASLSIPFCMIFTMIGLLIFNETINNIMQFGLIIIVGMVVDGAIVVMENIYRHREMGKSLINSSKDGTEEVGASVISSVLTTMAAFAPMLFMTGIIGDFMSAIPKTVILALSGSLLFDHIVIPVLCSKFLDVRAHDEVSPIVILFKKIVKVKSITKIHPFEWIFEKYKKLIRWSITHRKSVVLTTIAVFILGFGLLLSLSRESFPELDLGKLWVDIELPKNTKIEATNEVTEDIEKIIEKYRKTESNPKGIVKHYSVNVGSSGVQVFITGNIGQEQGPHIARIDIDLIDQEERDIGIDDFISKLRKEILEQCVGAKIKVNKPKGGPPTGATINIVISGDKLIELKRLANKAKAIINKIPGVITVEDNYGLGRPEIQILINRLKAERYGISVPEITNLLFILNNGYKVSTYQYRQKELEIRLKINERFKESIEDLKKLTIFSQKLLRPIPLSEVVDIKLEGGVSFIQREDRRRAIVVSGDVDRNIGTTAEISKSVIEILSDEKVFSLPKGYNVRFRGEDEDTEESFEGLKYSFLVGLMLIYFIVVIQLKSYIQPLAILITIMLSIVGVSLGLFLSGSNLGVMAMFGIVALAGVVVNDAIVLVSYINLLRDKGSTINDAIVEAGETRLRPILLTTFTTVGGLLPLALALGGTRTFWSPMGWAIIGGLTVATFQTLIVIPIVYSILEDVRVKAIKCFTDFSFKEKIYRIIRLLDHLFYKNK